MSRYFEDRRGPPARRTRRRQWPKLTVVAETSTHLICGLVISRGPSQDSPQFTPALRQAAQTLRPLRPRGVLADAAYDAERNHALCRERLGIPRTVIPLNRRNTGRRWPRARYRRQMRRRFCRRLYRQRWQAESTFSRLKRRLGAALTARTPAGQRREISLRVLTHDLLILRDTPCNLFNRACESER